MAPRKKAEETKTKPSPTPATRRSARMTRSAAKRLNARLTELPTDARKKRKQGKAEESKKKVKIETETVTATSTEAQAEVNTLEEEEEDDEDEDEDEDEADEEDAKEESTCTGDGVNKTIVIEHCKQCDAFQTRAMQVKDGLLSAFPGTLCCLILRSLEGDALKYRRRAGRHSSVYCLEKREQWLHERNLHEVSTLLSLREHEMTVSTSEGT